MTIIVLLVNLLILKKFRIIIHMFSLNKKTIDFSEDEILNCKITAQLLGYDFNNEAIEIMLQLFKLNIDPNSLTNFLYEVKKEF